MRINSITTGFYHFVGLDRSRAVRALGVQVAQ